MTMMMKMKIIYLIVSENVSNKRIRFRFDIERYKREWERIVLS